MKAKLLIPFLCCCIYSFGNARPPIDTLVFGEYEYYCGLACHQLLTLKKDFTYEYNLFGTSTICKGTFEIAGKRIKLIPAKGRETDLTEPKKLTVNKIDKYTILLITKRERYWKRKSD